jgi:hypothetical protein
MHQAICTDNLTANGKFKLHIYIRTQQSLFAKSKRPTTCTHSHLKFYCSVFLPQQITPHKLAYSRAWPEEPFLVASLSGTPSSTSIYFGFLMGLSNAQASRMEQRTLVASALSEIKQKRSVTWRIPFHCWRLRDRFLRWRAWPIAVSVLTTNSRLVSKWLPGPKSFSTTPLLKSELQMQQIPALWHAILRQEITFPYPTNWTRQLRRPDYSHVPSMVEPDTALQSRSNFCWLG